MTRASNNEYRDGRLVNGYDYDNQAWVADGRYVRCGHPESMTCGCYGRQYEGVAVRPLYTHIPEDDSNMGML